MLALIPLPLDPVTVKGAFIEDSTNSLRGYYFPLFSPTHRNVAGIGPLLLCGGGAFIEERAVYV